MSVRRIEFCNCVFLCAALLASCGDRRELVAHSEPEKLLTLLPKHVVAGYYPYWVAAPPRLRDVHVHYNVITIFLDQQLDEDGGNALSWTAPGDGHGAASNFIPDMQYVRKVQNRRIIVSVAGLDRAANFSSHGAALDFVDQLNTLYKKTGGFDGLDWGALDVAQLANQNQMLWISQELKRRYRGFIITASPLPWNDADKKFCNELLRQAAMDYVAPQFYDGSNLADSDIVVDSVREWTALLGAEHVVVGFGINSAANYQSANRAALIWKKLRAEYPGIHGASDWDIGMDERQGWAFAGGIGLSISRD